MVIRRLLLEELSQLDEIDATIESSNYLHVSVNGSGLGRGWQLDLRPAREKLIDPNRLSDDLRFSYHQVLTAIEEGIVLGVEHHDQIIGTLLAQLDAQSRLLRILDIRVEYDQRRRGVATVLLYQLISHMKQHDFRAVTAECQTNNVPACQFLAATNFGLSGIDTARHSNHDLVKEAATLSWHLPTDQ
ncbi:MAG: GNAT family N-acetyltransferase [Phycisphaerales bacterium]|nr:GNAT family N-acetyltransferase [Phycisphaerales bacterium]